MKKQITVRPEDRAEFHNYADLCVGTGRIDLALHREYQEQLRAVQVQCGFQMIRGHGLFSDQLGIYQQHTEPDGTKPDKVYTAAQLKRLYQHLLTQKPFDSADVAAQFDFNGDKCIDIRDATLLKRLILK